MILVAAVAALAFAAFPISAQTNPASAPAPKPKVELKTPVDHVKDLFDDYRQGDERGRFFGAAGVDGEITKAEFAAATGKPKSFVRSYDRWDLAATHDLDRNGRLNWPEAEKYRLGVKALVLIQHDKDKDGKLKGKERDATNEMLQRGLRLPRRMAWTLTRWDADKDGKLNAEERTAMDAERDKWRKRQSDWIKRWDGDEDGKLSREELETAAKSMRDSYEKRLLARHDTNKDGKLDDAERKVMRESWRKQMDDRANSYLLRKHDKDQDGTLNAEEQAAADAEKAQWTKTRNQLISRLDTDGDGEVSAEERKAAFAKIQTEMEKRRTAMDTDGDGQASPEEMREYFKKLQEKYDADGDGTLNEEERRKMIQTEAASFLGGRAAGSRP